LVNVFPFFVRRRGNALIRTNDQYTNKTQRILIFNSRPAPKVDPLSRKTITVLYKVVSYDNFDIRDIQMIHFLYASICKEKIQLEN
jgi:hypothetical protein